MDQKSAIRNPQSKIPQSKIPQSKISPVIRASELGEYAFCARSWWLRRVRGWRPANVEELTGGVEAHQRHGRLLWVGEMAGRAAWLLLLLAGLLFLVLLVTGGGR